MNKFEIETKLEEAKKYKFVWFYLHNNKVYGSYYNEIVNFIDKEYIYLKENNVNLNYSDITEIMLIN